MKSDLANYLPFVIFGAIALTFLFRIMRYGGFRGALFGAEIRRTVGEVKGAGRSIVNIGLKVHVLGGAPERAVGIEIVTKSFASYRMMPVSLSRAEAQRLITLLQQATGV